MRKVIVSTYVTPDGRVDEIRDWAVPYDDRASKLSPTNTDIQTSARSRAGSRWPDARPRMPPGECVRAFEGVVAKRAATAQEVDSDPAVVLLVVARAEARVGWTSA